MSFYGGKLLASSGRNFPGGMVTLRASDRVLLLGTRVSAFGGQNGGDITIDPALVTLYKAVLDADGGINGGNIDVHPGILLENASRLTATGTTGVNGDVAVTSPDVTLAGSLVLLPGSLALPGARLVPQCGLMLGGDDLSSFIVTGNGGEPPAPGGWAPDVWSTRDSVFSNLAGK